MGNGRNRQIKDHSLFRFLRRLAPRRSQIDHSDVPVSIGNTLDIEIEHRLRGNERIWAGFREIELRILSAETLQAVIRILSTDLPRFFPGVHAISLAWFDTNHELTNLLKQEGETIVDGTFVALHSPVPGLIPVQAPLLARTDAVRLEALFPRYTSQLKSMAIAPMFLRGELVGSLNQGSLDAGHFMPDAATDLLGHLAAVTAICIDNCVNRARLRHDGMTDMLTQVANRRFFDRRLQEEISQWRRSAGDLSCLLVDLDHFKQINDRHGHATGDLVLQSVAHSLSAGLRRSDVLARYGGEEFVLLLPATGKVRVAEIAERLRAAIAELKPVSMAGESLRLSASFGLATLTGREASRLADPGRWLMHQADRALYAAKAQGRNRVVATVYPESSGE